MLNDTQRKILLRVAAWATRKQEAAESLRQGEDRALTLDRGAFVARHEFEMILLALSPQQMDELRAGLDELAIGKAHEGGAR